MDKTMDAAVKHNFLPEQYKKDNVLSINHNYLRQQFSDYKEILREMEELIYEGEFTLGKEVDKFERKFSELTQSKHAVSVGSGTDAIRLSLEALGIKEGDEVITTPYTFFATVNAIATTGAKPVFVDVDKDYNIDPDAIEGAITPKTKAIVPVHWSGLPCKMDKIMKIAKRHEIYVIEDACHAIKAEHDGKMAGSFGNAGCFSLHPLKNLNAWGDGGVIVTDSDELHDKLVLLRNHGLINRDQCKVYGYNSRLDSIQAVVANHLIRKLDNITKSRISNANFYDEKLKEVSQIIVPNRDKKTKQVYHLYVIRAENRDKLQDYLIKNGIDAKVHYPIPMHLQPATKELGYKKGDFPMAEKVCSSVISLPVHEFITRDQQEHIIAKIKEFYNGN